MLDPRVNLGTGQGTFTGAPITPQFPIPPNNLGVQAMNDPVQRMRELYQPDTRATDKLYEMLEQIPERNKPGLLRKIAASVAGLSSGGPKAADQMLYAPYYKQLQEFETKFKPTEAVAQQERLQNVNLRQIASSVLANEAAQRRLDIQSQDANTRARRADIYAKFTDWKMQNQDWDIVKTEGGNYMLINKTTGETKDSGIPTGTLDELQELNLNIQARKDIARIPRTVISSGTTTSVTTPAPPTPNQEQIRRFNKALELYNSRPDLRPYIQLDPSTNAFEIAEPREGGFFRSGVPKDKIDEINRLILEQETPAPRTTTSQSNRTSTTGGAPSKPVIPVREPTPQPGRIIVEKDGKRFSLPATQREQALKQGYKEVK